MDYIKLMFLFKWIRAGYIELLIVFSLKLDKFNNLYIFTYTITSDYNFKECFLHYNI